ncbi:hypothetical protein [Streptomyces griseochromogenes]|uniref:hypothetical protein n=1 Tax=Streptomyces griseochromogenes TaxID=68214 RepID=UPI00379B056B
MNGSGAAEGARDEGRTAMNGAGGPGAVCEPGGPERPGMPIGADAWVAWPGQWPTGERRVPESAADGPDPGPRTASTAPAAWAAPSDAGVPTPADAPQAFAAPTLSAAKASAGSVGGIRPPTSAASARSRAARTPVPSAPVPGGAGAEPGRSRRTAPRRGTADPVKALLHRHRKLCERAVDPLEIAAGLEALGMTDRTAARFRHRDVFSLAEELYARVPRDGAARPHPEPVCAPRVGADWILLTLLPGALGAATLAGLRLAHGHSRPLVALGGLLAVGLAIRAALRRGPLAATPGAPAWRTGSATRAWTLCLLGYALLGDGLLRAILAGGPDALPTGAPDGPWPASAAPVLALTLACAPAAWCTYLFAAGARRRLAGSRGLEDFTAATRPLLLGTVALFLGALTGLLALCGAALHESAHYPQTLTLGALLLLARLLTVHHRRHAPALVLGAAAATEAAALALPLAGRLPGCAFLATPVQTLVDAWGTAGVPALACGAAALTLLVHAQRTLTRASAHAPTGAPE